MTTSTLRRATASANPTPQQARSAAEILADLALQARRAFSAGGPVPGVAPASITPTWGDRPKFRDMEGRYGWERSDADPALLAALAVAHGQRPTFANGGIAHTLPARLGQSFVGSGVMRFHGALSARPHFADGGGADDGMGVSSFVPSSVPNRISDDGMSAIYAPTMHPALSDDGMASSLALQPHVQSAPQAQPNAGGGFSTMPAAVSGAGQLGGYSTPQGVAGPSTSGDGGGFGNFVMPSILRQPQSAAPNDALGYGGGFARGGAVLRPFADRPHFEAGGDASRGYGGDNQGDNDNNGGVGNGGWSSGYGGFGLGGVGSQSSSNGGNPSHGSQSTQNGGGGGFNSGAAAGSSTGGYGGFGGYSSSASVGGSYGGAAPGGSYSSSAISSGGSSSMNGGYGSVAGSLGQMGSTGSYGGSMSSNGMGGSNNNGGNNAGTGSSSMAGTSGFGGLSGFGSYSGTPASGFGSFNSNNTGSGVGNVSSNNGFGGLGSFSGQANEPGNASLAAAMASMGTSANGTYAGYRGAGTASTPSSGFGSFSGTQDGYGTNVAVAAANAAASQPAASPFGALAGVNAPATVGGQLSHTADQTPGFAGFGQQVSASQPGFSSFGAGPQSEAAADAEGAGYGFSGYHPDGALGVSQYGGYNATAQTPSDAFSAGVRTGAAMASGAAGMGLADSGGLATTAAPSSLSPSIQSAMMGRPVSGDAAGAVANATGVNPASSISVPGMGYDASASTSADPAGALTVHGPYSGVTTTNALGPGTNVVGDFGGIANMATPSIPGQLTAAQQAQMDAYTAQHQALADKTKAMADGIDNAPSMFRGMAGQFLGAEPDAIKGWLADPQQHPEVAAAMSDRLGQLQHEVDTGTVGGFMSTDRHGLNSMMSEGGFANENDAIAGARSFISGKMSDVAPSFSVTGTPGYSIGSMPSMGASVSSANDSFGITGGLSPSIAAAAGLTATNDPSSVDGIHALTVHGPTEATGFDGAPMAGPGSWNGDGATSFGAVPSNAPVGMRNNNLGNIAFGNYAVAHGAVDSGARDVDHNIAQFSSQEDGVRAAAALAASKYDKGMTTANSLIAGPGGWTPGSLGPGAAVNVAASMGLGPNDDLGLNNPDRMTAFLSGLGAQEHGEAGKSYYSREAISNALYGGSQDEASDTRNFAITGLQNSAMASPAAIASAYSAGMPGVGMSDVAGPFGSLAGISGSLPSFAAADRALTAAGMPGYGATSDGAVDHAPTVAANQNSPAAAVGEAPKKADDLSTAQKSAKLGINVGLGLIPGVGPVLAAGNALSGLLGYGTIGEYMARNASPAQVGSPAMAGAAHTSAGGFTGGTAPYYDPDGFGYHGGNEGGYGSLPSATGSAANYGVQRVDPNAAAATALAAIGGASSMSTLSPSIQAAVSSVGEVPNAVAANGVAFYDPMKDPVVVNALRLARGEKLAA